MKKLYISKSNNENYYFIDNVHKVIQLVHPELARLYLESTSHDVSSYYVKKKAYLTNHMQFLNNNEQFNLKKIAPKDIEHNIITTSQLTFEVTDKCNLQCKYCGFGELYDNYDERSTKDADIHNATSLIDFYFELCRKHSYVNKNLNIGFYGGEPLMNFAFVKDIIKYIEAKYPGNYTYHTTTNGVLLKRYIDYLVEKKFMLSISLDGDEFSNSYRIDHNGAPTFHKVVENVNYIKENFPLYYENNVNFNAVFHNRNTLPNILSFFKQIFAKTPMIGRINDGGIHPEKKDLFNKMYLNTSSFDYTNATIEDIIEKPFLIQNHTMFLHNNLFSIYRDYLILLSENKDSEIYPTATCSPLKKRIFLTVNGKILPCEKVGHNHSLGNVSNGVTDIDFEEVAQKINKMYEMIYNKQCITCDLVSNCSICMFQCDLNCPVKGDGSDYFQSEMDFFELQPDLFNELVTKVILR